MAVMLRTLGIPSRVVNGFRTDEFNDLTGNYVVRAKDAHAWVEAYFPGYGWQTFDPTPAGDNGTPQGWDRVALYIDAMASFWRDWIVSYDSTHQYVLGQAAVSGTRGLWEGARDWARNQYESMLQWARRSQDRVEHSPTPVGRARCGHHARFSAARKLGTHRAPAARKVVARPSRAIPGASRSHVVQPHGSRPGRRGVEEAAGPDAQEFVRKIEDTALREPVARFTEVYESARFGNSAEDVQRLPELYDDSRVRHRNRQALR